MVFLFLGLYDVEEGWVPHQLFPAATVHAYGGVNTWLRGVSRTVDGWGWQQNDKKVHGLGSGVQELRGFSS